MAIDLSAAARITSPVLGKLVTLHRKALAAGSELRVCCPEGSIRDVFRLTKLDKLIPTFPTLADALRDF